VSDLKSNLLPLAHGDLSPDDAAELQLLKAQIEREIGIYCEGYKEHCLRRRIAVRMRACGLHTYADYARLLRSNAEEHKKLLDVVTINVSKFFRNKDLWSALEHTVLPALFELRARPTRLWSAGCAAGEEPFTMAMLLKDYARRTGRERELTRFQLRGTDIDARSLAQAEVGRYGNFAFTDIEPEMRAAWFTGPERDQIKPEIRDMVRFQTADLIKDSFEPDQHLILCRNVIIYFERAVQEQLFSKFHEALAPGGFLVLGKVETIFGPAAHLFRPVAQRERVFVRI